MNYSTKKAKFGNPPEFSRKISLRSSILRRLAWRGLAAVRRGRSLRAKGVAS